jgi:iron-sulfur cluster repair protein YtfE (RIC family)
MNAVQDWPALVSRESVHELILYLRDHVHACLRQILAKLDWLTDRIAGEKVVPPVTMDQFQRRFLTLADGLEAHLAEQECWLFPTIGALIRPVRTGGPDRAELDDALHEAASANQELLAGMEQLQMDLCDPTWADRGSLVERLIDDLRELEEQLVTYAQLESEVLFPQVQALLEARRSAVDGVGVRT